MPKLIKPMPLHKRKLVQNGSLKSPAWAVDAVPIGAMNIVSIHGRFSSAITYKLLCAAGALVQGSAPDLLVCLLLAKEAKEIWEIRLPDATFRIHLFYPNRQRVPTADIAAALKALDDKDVGAAVARRRAAVVSNTPARSEARTAVFETPAGRGLAVAVDVDFSQAGVVAPPDGLTGGTPVLACSVGDSV